MLTIVIPWRPQPSRLAAFAEVTAWYRQHLPEAELHTVDSGDAIFNLARCRNLGVSAVSDPDEVVILGDADTVPEEAALRSAIEAASTSGRVHLPYTEYHWLGAVGTAEFLEGLPPEDCSYELVRGACSVV